MPAVAPDSQFFWLSMDI